MPPTSSENRYGPCTRVEVLVRARGVTFAKGLDADGGPVLLQCTRLGKFDDAAARTAYVEMVARATELLEGPDTPAVAGHGLREDEDGDELYWILEWPNGAARIGHAPLHVDSAEHLGHIASALLERLQRRHDAGALDPLLSVDTLVLHGSAGVRVVGLPIHLPPRGLGEGQSQAPYAPEEVEAGEPSRAGDLWRAGRALIDLAAPLGNAPAGLIRVLEQLAAESPKARFDSAEAALIELEALQSTLATSREAFEAAQAPAADGPLAAQDFPRAPSGARGPRDEQPTTPQHDLGPDLGQDPAADLLQDELLAQATIAMDSTPAVSPEDADPGDTSPDEIAGDDGDADTSPQFPSPIAGERRGPDKELATVRLPFPAELKRQAEAEIEEEPRVPPGRVTHVAAPSDIPEAETLLEVRRPAQPPIPVGAQTVVDARHRDVGDGPEATIRDVSLERLEKEDAGDEFPTMDEVPSTRGKSAWDRSAQRKPLFDPTQNRPHGGQALPPKTAPMGPQGTLVGARIINDPTGLRQQVELPGLLPPPTVGAGAPLADMPDPSSDLELPPRATSRDLPPGPHLPSASPHGPMGPGGPMGPTGSPTPPPMAPAMPAPHALSADLNPMLSAHPGHPAAPPPALAPPAPSASAPPLVPPVAPPSAPVPAPGPAASLSGPPLPAPKRSKVGVLIGAAAFFVAGGAAAFALPYLFPAAAPTTLTKRIEPPEPKTYAITPANEVLLQASPASALVVSESDGRVLGRTPMRFLVPPGMEAAIYVAADGHEPQRVDLPVRGRIRTDLVPLADGTPCKIALEVPARVSIEGVAAAVSGADGEYEVPGAALLRAKIGEGAWLVRCPRLGGQAKQVLPARALPTRAELRVVGPSNATVYVDGEEVGTTPMRTKAQTGFREVSVEKLSAGARVTRWLPVLGDVKVRMPRPRK